MQKTHDLGGSLAAFHVRPLYTAPVAQQPQKLEDSEQYRMQMAGISVAAMGYWKEGDSIHPDYDTPALRDVAKLYAKYDALYKAQQPQAEAVPTNCTECRNADSWGVPDQPVCRSCRAGSAWEPLNKSSVNPNKKPQAEAVPPDVVRDAVAAEREACAALAQGYACQVGDVAWAVAAAIRGRGNAALAQQKGQP